jgi:signal transduction histidine kinase
VLTSVAAVLSVGLLAASWHRSLTDDLFGGVGGVAFVVLSLACATVGAMIASRVGTNPVGWIFVAIGLVTGVGTLAYEYAANSLSRGGGMTGTALAAWLSSPVAEPTAGLFGLVLLLFPDGRLLSARWRPAVWVVGVGTAALVVSSALSPGRLDAPFAALVSPIGISGGRRAMVVVDSAGWVMVVIGLALGPVSAVIRLRRARGEERQQLKLVLSAGAVIAAAITLDMASWFVWPHGHLVIRMAVIGVSFSAFAIAVGVAVLRYRLYDVDAAIERTLVYVTLTLLLAAGYVLTTLVLGTGLGSSSRWATAGATLVVAVTFRPLRARLQDIVDRRFGRARYEARRRITAFLEDLRAGHAEPESIEPLLGEVLADPLLELHFFLPESGLFVDAAGRAVFDAPGDTRLRWPIERAGRPLARVLYTPAGSQRRALLGTSVDAGSLAIEIARLRVELRRHLSEVESSRARIIAAGHAERRRIERDLHDGAQQRLVSIGLELRHAQHQLGHVPAERTSAALERAVSGLEQAITELRELAQGLPPSQLDAGLEPALRELAGRAPITVEVRTSAERYDIALEATAYFIACEGLTNAIKHAQATGVTVSATRQDGSLVISIADNGVGGAHSQDGSGLRGLSDRVASLGGRLHIESERNAGTTLTAELPCAS